MCAVSRSPAEGATVAWPACLGASRAHYAGPATHGALPRPFELATLGLPPAMHAVLPHSHACGSFSYSFIFLFFVLCEFFLFIFYPLIFYLFWFYCFFFSFYFSIFIFSSCSGSFSFSYFVQFSFQFGCFFLILIFNQFFKFYFLVKFFILVFSQVSFLFQFSYKIFSFFKNKLSITWQ